MSEAERVPMTAGLLPGVMRITRAAIAITIAAAIVYEYNRLSAHDGFDSVNFFSYFTILSNIGATVLLAWEAALRPPAQQGSRAIAVRGAVTLYMCMTGIVYAVLLAPSDVGKPAPWVDFVVHVLAPIALALDWFVNPPRRLPGRRVVAAWLVWPLVYVVYSLLRGHATDWYPYPFLNPDESGGYAGVVGYSAGVFAAFLAVGLVLYWWATRSRDDDPPACP